MISDLIYDVGLHTGEDTAYYLNQGYRVVAIEANPLLVEQCRKRFENAIASGRLHILPIGIAGHTGFVPFFIHPTKDDWSSTVEASGWRATNIGGGGTVAGIRIDAPCCTFDVILKHYGMPYYIKSDIELGDEHILQALHLFDPKELPKYISIEAHTLNYLVELSKLGYTDFKIVDQTQHNVAPKKTNVTFPAEHSSGAFGEQAKGEWAGINQIAYEWLHDVNGHAERSAYLTAGSWHDFHARRPD